MVLAHVIDVAAGRSIKQRPRGLNAPFTAACAAVVTLLSFRRSLDVVDHQIATLIMNVAPPGERGFAIYSKKGERAWLASQSQTSPIASRGEAED